MKGVRNCGCAWEYTFVFKYVLNCLNVRLATIALLDIVFFFIKLIVLSAVHFLHILKPIQSLCLAPSRVLNTNTIGFLLIQKASKTFLHNVALQTMSNNVSGGSEGEGESRTDPKLFG